MNRDYSEIRRRIVFALGALPLLRGAAMAADIEEKRTGGPYVPTPQVVVDQMLRIGHVGSGDFVVDLGSGDGVIVLTAASQLGARGFGVDIDPDLVKLANGEATKRGIADRAAFYVQDVFKTDIGKATVVTLYLLPQMMLDLRPKILKELKPGTRVVSHDYHFDDWMPDDQFTWDVPEKEAVIGVAQATVYLWVIPARVAGRWQVSVAGSVPARLVLALNQHYQDIVGTFAEAGGRERPLTLSRLSGAEITFALPWGRERHVFKGRIAGDVMEGTVQAVEGKGGVKWTAIRIKA